MKNYLDHDQTSHDETSDRVLRCSTLFENVHVSLLTTAETSNHNSSKNNF